MRTWPNFRGGVLGCAGCWQITFLAAACASISLAADSGAPGGRDGSGEFSAGRVSAVTVYQGQALVTRAIEVPGGEAASLRELVVDGLPDRILPSSVHAEGGQGVSVRSVRYRVRAVPESPRPEVRALDDQIAGREQALRSLRAGQEQLKQSAAFLDKLEGFTGGVGATTAGTAAFNGAAIREVAEYILTQRRQLAEQQLKTNEQIRSEEAAKSLLERQRKELTPAGPRESREALISVESQQGGGLVFLHYLVDNASWSASYTARTTGDRKTVTLEYNAAIQQQTGEDWNNVKMMLSTASPALVSRAPTLSRLGVSLTRERKELARAIEYQRQQLGNSNLFMRGDLKAAEMNDFANSMQMAEILEPGENDGNFAPVTTGLSVVYAVSSATTLPSRPDRQLVQIGRYELAADPYKLASPVLTEYVFDECRVRNTTGAPLLNGPVASYVDAQFVGNANFATLSGGEEFTIGFGIDSNLRSGRRLVEKRETNQGGNRVVDLVYELTVDNFAADAVPVRLYDRLPVAADTDVRVTLNRDSPELSSDPQYLQAERADGLLRWDVKTPGASQAPNRATIRYGYRMEYDKQFTLSGM